MSHLPLPTLDTPRKPPSALGVRLLQAALLLGALLGSSRLSAGEVGSPVLAKLLRVLAISAGGSGKVACNDRELTARLQDLGVAEDQGAKIAWAANKAEAAAFAKQGRLVVCEQLDFIACGACVVITAEGGRPAIYFNSTNLATARMALPDALVKISKVAK